MAQVVISNINQQQLFQVQYANNIKWRKALNTVGFASFDIPLTNAYASPTWIHAGNYVHIYNDSANTANFANADWGGILTNDYMIKPKEGVISLQAAGLAQLLQLSIVSTTTVYSGQDLGSIVKSLVATRDNAAAVSFTPYTVSALGPTVQTFIAGFGDPVMADIVSLMSNYGCDFEVRPDFTYAFYIRQGQDRKDLVARYGDRGNMALESQMHLVNSELFNQVWYVGASSTQYVADPTSAQQYGKRTIVIQDSTTYDNLDITTKAQLELAKRHFPLFVLDNVQVIDTPLLPFSQLRLGDRITFEAPSIPFLQTFNGLQRILAIDYDDVRRTMDLTMGNAVYTVLRGKLHEIRLYT